MFDLDRYKLLCHSFQCALAIFHQHPLVLFHQVCCPKVAAVIDPRDGNKVPFHRVLVLVSFYLVEDARIHFALQ